jgi:hypothetical protein
LQGLEKSRNQASWPQRQEFRAVGDFHAQAGGAETLIGQQKIERPSTRQNYGLLGKPREE